MNASTSCPRGTPMGGAEHALADLLGEAVEPQTTMVSPVS